MITWLDPFVILMPTSLKIVEGGGGGGVSQLPVSVYILLL